MAKELPYFKFEPNQWENGNIQMLSREDKGLFIDLCSMYWSRLGDLPEKLAIQKLCAGNATALNSLCDEKIIEVLDGNIYIKFLSEQLNEFEDISKKNSKNAKDGWKKRRKLNKNEDLSERNATALNSQCESDAIREEKIREDKRIDDDVIIPTSPIFIVAEKALEILSMKNDAFAIYATRRTKKTVEQLEAFKSQFITDQKALGKKTWQSEQDCKKHFIDWVNKQQPTQTLVNQFLASN
jgi:hypothetical protein